MKDIQYNITHNCDNMEVTDVLMVKRLVEEGYTFPISEQQLEYSDYLKLYKILEDKYNPTKHDFSHEKSVFHLIKTKEFAITAVGDLDFIYIDIMAKNVDTAEAIFSMIKGFESRENEVEVILNSYFLTGNKIDNTIKVFNLKDFKDTSNLYYPYIDTDSMFEQFYGNNENILICCGKPGVGKSKRSSLLLKYSILNPTKIPYSKTEDNIHIDVDFLNVAYVKSTELLAMDNFWRILADKNFDLVILDDLDYFLTSRSNEALSQEDVDKNKFLSQFLSFTDGIEKNNTKFIISSNQPFDDIDIALLRKGRLFDVLELRELSQKEALKIWLDAGLSDELFNKQKFSDNILQAELGSIITKLTNKKITIKPYLKEKGISKLKVKPKKLGF